MIAVTTVAIAGLLHGRTVCGQGTRVELRVGVAASSPLVRDAIATATATDSLLPPGKRVSAARVGIGASPAVTLALIQGTTRPIGVEADLGWTFGRVRAEGGAGGYGLGTVGIAEAAVAARWRFAPRLHARAGAGVLAYRGWTEGVFRGNNQMEPMGEVGVGTVLPAVGSRLTLELTLQAHPFHTAGLADEGERSGGVLRGLLQMGIRLGGGG